MRSPLCLLFLLLLPSLIAAPCPLLEGNRSIAAPGQVEVNASFSATVSVDNATHVGLRLVDNTTPLLEGSGENATFSALSLAEEGPLIAYASFDGLSFVEVARCDVALFTPEPECAEAADCEDGNPCTRNECVGGFCEHENRTFGDLCGFDPLKRCSAPEPGGDSQCRLVCSLAGGVCLAEAPLHASLSEEHFCSEGDCYRCDRGYDPIGDLCVESTTCDGDVCVNASHLLPCVDDSWAAPRRCIFACADAACVSACEDLEACVEQGARRCDGRVLESCDFHRLGCLHWASLHECAGGCEAGACTGACQPADWQGCHENSIHWFDSCGALGALVEACGQATCVEDDAPACVAAPPSCTGDYRYECRASLGVRVDESCGVVETAAICGGGQSCYADGGRVRCVDECPATRCADRCVDPMTDRFHCGQCDNRCAGGERCVEGRCLPAEGCAVACWRNADCAKGEVCVHPGDCTRSACLLLDQEEELLDALSEESVGAGPGSGLLSVDYSLEGRTFTFVVTSFSPATLEGVSFVADFHKSIAASADELRVKGVAYEVVEEDPILRFHFPELSGTQRFTVTAGHDLDESYVQYVALDSFAHEAPAGVRSRWDEAKELIDIAIGSRFDGERTSVDVNISSNLTMEEVTVPVLIPKCLALYASELDLSGRYRIVKEDPLIVWQFATVKRPVTITFSVEKEVDEECLQQLEAMAFAKRFKEPLSPWWLLLTLPLVGVILFLLNRQLSPPKPDSLSKREFFRIGREQGDTEEDLRNKWDDYQEELQEPDDLE